MHATKNDARTEFSPASGAREKPSPYRPRKRRGHPPRERPDVVLRVLVLGLLFAAAFYAIRADWMVLGRVDVRGGVRLSDEEIVELAALNDFDDAWTIFVARESIRRSLEKHPLIEHADISITGPWSVTVRISERRPVAAIDRDGFRFLFDRTGELIDILAPSEPCLYPEVRGVPPGLLRFRHEPLYRHGSAWGLPGECVDAETMERQFNRLIHLEYLLDRWSENCDRDLEGMRMDDDGRLTVEFADCPPIILGDFDNPDLQFRRMLAVLRNEEITNPERTLDIDLSSELFPCYHIRKEYYSRSERRQAEEWEREATAEASDDSGSADGAVFEEPDGEPGEVIIGPAIFGLAGGESSDEEE